MIEQINQHLPGYFFKNFDKFKDILRQLGEQNLTENLSLKFSLKIFLTLRQTCLKLIGK